ncbi:hypothetical protein QQS21_004904 [Conoideocrella luteorostrata]|uniref:ABC transporter n=1 Tax=Conoideocrella luteorostrata TaxID=1105319 RepID=A0AAJ0CRF4_9HYPO|nr:hypothetical protein QQS21_004904 [Conoideocrella luteorostrata]
MSNLVMRAIGAVGDDEFGPQLWPQFDFTLLFEHAIFTIIPSGLLIIASPFYLFYYFRSPIYVTGSALLWAKLAATGGLLGTEIASLVTCATLPVDPSAASLAATSLSCVGAMCIVAVINLEHRHSLRSSSLISLYLGLTLLFDIVKSRSYLLRPGLRVHGGLSAATAVIKLVLVLLEEIPKKEHIRNPKLKESLSKESASGFWNRSLFIWLNSTFLLGFRNILKVDHLGSLGSEFSSEQLTTRFEPIWQRRKQSPYCLLRASFLTLFWPFFAVVLPRLLNIGFTFSQPFLLQRIVRFLGEENPSISVRNGLIGATMLVYLGKAMTTASYTHMNYRLITRLRGILISQILKKNFVLNQLDARNGAAITLMSTDVEGLAIGLPKFHDIWASVIEFGLGAYFISTEVGPATFLIVIPALLTTVSAYLFGKAMMPARSSWNKQIERRVAITSSVLSQIKSIRMTGLKNIVGERVQELRETEMTQSKSFRVIWVMMKSVSILSGTLAPILIITAALFWTKFKNGLTAADTFTTLAFIALTELPLRRIMNSYPLFTSILSCFRRIQEYLLLEERHDGRETISDLFLRNNGYDEKDTSRSSVTPINNKPSIELQLPQPPIIFVNAFIAPTAGKEPLLKDVNLSVLRSEIAVVLGRTGSGKSILLKAILGEAPHTSGLIYVEQRQIAYCDQSPWLKDISIRENIVMDHKFDRDWYETLLDACLLKEDLRQLPDGDQTTAGNGGVNLSGGQRQRVALARAIYSRSTLLVLDNVFSSLDNNTANAIFYRLFTPNGLLKRLGSTVIMTTHSVEFVKTADRIIMIEDDGSVKSSLNTTGVMYGDAQLHALMEQRVDESKERADFEAVQESDDPTPSFLSSRQRGDAKLYSFYLQSIGLWSWLTWLCTMLMASVTERMPDIFVRIWLDHAPKDKLYLIGYVLFGISNCIVSAITLGFYYLRVVPNSSENLHRKLLDTVMEYEKSFLIGQFAIVCASSNLKQILPVISFFNEGWCPSEFDMTLVSQELPLGFYLFIYYCFLTLTDIGIITSIAAYVAPIIPFIFAFLYVIQYFYLRTSRQIRLLDLEAKTPLYSQFAELGAGLLHIRSFGWDTKYLSQGFQLLDYSQTPFYYMFCIQRWLTLVVELAVLGVATALVSTALCTDGATSQNAMGLALLNLVNFGAVLTGLIEDWISLETSLGAIFRIQSFTKNTPTEQDRDGAHLPPGCLKQGSIQMANVVAVYNTSGSSSPKVALNGVNLNIRPGQKVSIVGRTGSGKSSLLLTLLNFLDYTGMILIDNVDLMDIPRQDLRHLITTISQDLVELPGTVRQNLLPTVSTQVGAEVYDAMLKEVLERIGLLTYIIARGGLEEPFSEMGFSHGQRQLLSIARAILHKAETESKILLVDEATSAVDSETAHLMQDIMDEAFGDCTTITVSHRPEAIQSSDMVIEIGNGQIISIVER